jgi:hypothetical protein
MTLWRLENGDTSVSFGLVLRVLSILSMIDDIDKLAQEDPLGRILQDSKQKRPRSSHAEVSFDE